MCNISQFAVLIWAGVILLGGCQPRYTDTRYTSNQNSDEPLINTRWILMRLGRENVGSLESDKYLQFSHDSLSVRGFAGCNQFFGRYEVRRDSLRISNVGSTRKLCTNQMATEENFLHAIQQTNRYRIKGDRLKFYRGDTLLASFQAINLPK